ncbi:MAG: rane protein [Rubritepida sp.]|nr:rane protein [Rubritepida sp.]
MRAEIDIYGVYVPSFLILMLGAYVVMQILRRILVRTGFYAFVWHRALFNLSLYVLILGGAWGLAQRMARSFA